MIEPRYEAGRVVHDPSVIVCPYKCAGELVDLLHASGWRPRVGRQEQEASAQSMITFDEKLCSTDANWRLGVAPERLATDAEPLRQFHGQVVGPLREQMTRELGGEEFYRVAATHRYATQAQRVTAG